MNDSYWANVLDQHISRRRGLTAAGGAGLGAALPAASGNAPRKSKTNTAPPSPLAQPVDESKTAKHGGTVVSAGRALTSLDPIGSSAIGINYRMYSTLWKKKDGYLGPYKGEIVGDVV